MAKHLGILSRAGLVEQYKQGRRLLVKLSIKRDLPRLKALLERREGAV